MSGTFIIYWEAVNNKTIFNKKKKTMMEWPYLAWPATHCLLCFNSHCFSSGSRHLVISSLEKRRAGL